MKQPDTISNTAAGRAREWGGEEDKTKCNAIAVSRLGIGVNLSRFFTSPWRETPTHASY